MNLAWLVSAALIAELFLRLLFPQPSYYWATWNVDTLDRWNKPGETHSISYSSDLNGVFSFDEHGFAPRPEPSRETGDKAIVLGGSIALGWPHGTTFANFLQPYEVINCSSPFSNLATYLYFIDHQCKGAVSDAVKLVVIQLDMFALPDDTNLWLMGLLYGENLIEDPYLFANLKLRENLQKYQTDLRFRATGVPYLAFTREEFLERKNAIEHTSIFYARSHLVRFLEHRLMAPIRFWQIAKAGNALQRFLHRKLPALPSTEVSLRVVREIRSRFGKNTRVVVLLVPNANGMLLSSERALYKDYLERRRAGYLKIVEQWTAPYGGVDKTLDTFRGRVQEFKSELAGSGILAVDASEIFAGKAPEELYLEDAHHLGKTAQEELGAFLMKSISQKHSAPENRK